jgi:hypothetical protein
MKHAGIAILLGAALLAAGCGDRRAAAPQAANHTAVLGAAEAPLTDAHGQAIPPPNVPAGVHAQVARSGDETALAVWVQDGHVVAASYDRAHGWSAPQPLEQIYGEASDPQLASNGHGVAMALWRHTVGEIQSLRASRYDAASGWSAPDVVPGAVPRPRSAGARGVPQLQMDAQGNVVARWTSALPTGADQVARYEGASGWKRAVTERVASAPAASAAASSVR